MIQELLHTACSRSMVQMHEVIYTSCAVTLTVWSAFISAIIGILPGPL